VDDQVDVLVGEGSREATPATAAEAGLTGASDDADLPVFTAALQLQRELQ